MKLKVVTLSNEVAGNVELKPEIFGLPVRKDILQRVVEWQRAKKRAGTHKTKEIGEVSGTTKKPYKQKGTGHARQGSLRSPQFRKGAVIFGPVVRSHAYDLPKKVRKLGLKIALSAKAAEGKLIVLQDAKLSTPKTAFLNKSLEAIGGKSFLIIDGKALDQNFKLAASNIHGVDVLPQQGINVYDILRHENLLLTVEALKCLEERLHD